MTAAAIVYFFRAHALVRTSSLPDTCTHAHVIQFHAPFQLLFSSLLFSYTSSAPDGALHVDLTSPHARIARRSELHYLGGGLYLFRYRIFHEAKAASLSVQIGQTHVADSPYSLGDLLPETCYCPTRTIDEWRSDFSCPTSYYQIDADLSLFNEGGGIDISNLYERLEAQFPRSNVIHYSIVSNKVSSILVAS